MHTWTAILLYTRNDTNYPRHLDIGNFRKCTRVLHPWNKSIKTKLMLEKYMYLNAGTHLTHTLTSNDVDNMRNNSTLWFWNMIFLIIIATHSSVARQTCIDSEEMACLTGNGSQRRSKVADSAKIEESCHLYLACFIRSWWSYHLEMSLHY